VSAGQGSHVPAPAARSSGRRSAAPTGQASTHRPLSQVWSAVQQAMPHRVVPAAHRLTHCPPSQRCAALQQLAPHRVAPSRQDATQRVTLSKSMQS
jgi:hypothetical protein